MISSLAKLDGKIEDFSIIYLNLVPVTTKLWIFLYIILCLIISTCFECLCKSWFTAACICVADHADGVDLPTGQLVEGAVGAAGVAGGGHSSAVHR